MTQDGGFSTRVRARTETHKGKEGLVIYKMAGDRATRWGQHPLVTDGEGSGVRGVLTDREGSEVGGLVRAVF